MKIELRPISDSDNDFLRSVYAATRAQEMALVPWPPDQKQAFIDHQFKAQHDHYRSKFPDASFDVIVVDSQLAGRLYVYRGETQIRILDIGIAADFETTNVEEAVIAELINEAAEKKQPLRIYLETNDPQVPVFTRMGFNPTTSEDGFRWLYERSP